MINIPCKTRTISSQCKGTSILAFVERKGEFTTVSMTYTTRVLVRAAEQI